MRLCEIKLVLRKDGHFYYNGKKIKAYHPGDGYGVDMVFVPSQLDIDFGDLPEIAYTILKGLNVKFHFFISSEEYEKLDRKLNESDKKTHKLLGRGWNGKRPYWKLHDFM